MHPIKPGRRLKLERVLGSYALRQAGGVGSLAITPCGARAWTAGEFCLTEWDLATGEELRSFASQRRLAAVSLSPDGAVVAAGGTGGLDAWSTASGERLGPFPALSYPQATAISSTGLLLAADERTPRLFDLERGTEVGKLKGHRTRVDHVAFSPCGSLALTAGGDEIKLQRVAKPEVLATWGGYSSGVVFSADGRWALSSGWDHVKVFEVGTRVEWLSLETTCRAWEPPPDLPHTVAGAAFSPDGEWIAFGTRDSVWIVERSSGALLRQIHQPNAKRLAFTPDGRRLAATGGRTAMAVFDVASGERLLPHGGHYDAVTGLAASRPGLVSVSADRTLKTWALDDPLEQLTIRAAGQLRALVVHDAQAVSLEQGKRHAHLWCADLDRGVGRPLEDEPEGVYEERPEARALAMSSDGGSFVCARGRELERFALPEWRSLGRFGKHRFVIQAMAFSQGGSQVVSGAQDEWVKRWDLETGEQLARLEASFVQAVVSLGDHGVAFGEAEGGLKVWGREAVRSLKGRGEPVELLAASDDGRWLAAATGHGGYPRVDLYDVRAGQRVDRVDLGPSQDWPTSLCFASGRLCVGTARGVILVLALS